MHFLIKGDRAIESLSLSLKSQLIMGRLSFPHNGHPDRWASTKMNYHSGAIFSKGTRVESSEFPKAPATQPEAESGYCTPSWYSMDQLRGRSEIRDKCCFVAGRQELIFT